ncbi:D39U1 protein, partial [Cisticola juncidis]|nr:D39U1 protein [Cisticola juncidis]
LSLSPGGGTGFVGRALTQLLRSRGHQVTHVSRRGGEDRITWEELSRSGLPLCEAVVNLAGENVLNPLRRWGDAFCREVISSRVETTKSLAKAIAAAEQPPRAWVLVTGVGYYRPSPTAEYTEDSPGGDFDFFSRLVSSWEAAALIPGSPTRGVVVRSAIVLHSMLGQTRLCDSPLDQCSGEVRIPSSNPQISWEMYKSLKKYKRSFINKVVFLPCMLCDPRPVSQSHFPVGLAVIGVLLQSSPLRILLLVAWAVRAALGPERAAMLLEGQRVLPQRTLHSGYRFIFPELPAALKDIVA